MRSKLVCRATVISIALFLLSSLVSAQDANQNRIVRPVDNRIVVPLTGTLSPRARAQNDRGPASGQMPMRRMTMVFSRTAAQEAALDQLLDEQQDPASFNYHKWLTPEEFGDRFGVAEQDANLIARWLTAQGFTVDEIARSRTWIAFSGIASQAEAALHTQIHTYVVNGETHYAPSVEPSIPDAFADVVATINSLDDFRPRPKSISRHRTQPHLTSSITGNHFLAPGDFGTIYDLPDYANGSFQPGNDGTGQTIGIVGQTRLTSSGTGPFPDIDTFRSVSVLPALTVAPTTSTPNLTVVLPSGATDPGFSTTDIEEANLDLQWAGAVAPNANLIFAYSNNALTNSLQYLVNQNAASVISISYGNCEADFASSDFTTIEGYLQQANAQGQTVIAAAGDNGATDCDGTAQKPATIATHGLAVDYPASSPHVIAMGGTEFTGDAAATVSNGVAAATQYWDSSSDPNNTSASAFSYIPETTWNDTSSTISATGGGVSKQFSKPSWQNGVTPADGQRDVPDLALASSPSHDGFIICSQGTCQTGYRRNSDQTFTVIGGTSAATPPFAGIIALINQKLGVRHGNVSPQIYSLTATSSWAFNDITTGNNNVPCQSGTPNCPNGGTIGYAAGTDYDLVTGWGSVDAMALIDAFNGTPNPHFVVLPASRNMSLATGGSSTAAVTVTPKEGFSGTVSLSCSLSTSLSGVTCSFANSSVTTPGTANLTLQAGSTQVAQTGTLTLQGTSGSASNTVAINVTVSPPDFQLSSGNGTETVIAGSTTTDTVSVTSLQGFTGSVSFSCTGTTGLTCSLSPNAVTASTSSAVTSTLSVAASSSAVTGLVTITATSGTLTHTLQIPVTVSAAPAADFTLTASTTSLSISSGQSGSATLTVAPVSSFSSDVALTCTVSSALGSTTCSATPTTITGGNGTATLTVQGAVLSMDRRPAFPFSDRKMGIEAGFVFALGIVFTLKPNRSARAKAAFRNILLGLLLLCISIGAVSCGGGGGSSSTPTSTPLSGTVTVTGTSGTLTHSVSIAVTIH